jgi:hypothetical protein
MNRGEFQTSLVQQMIWSGTGSGGGNTATASSNNIMSSFKSCHEDQEASPILPSLSSPSMLFPQQFLHTGTSSGQLGHINGGAAGSLTSLQDGGSGQENHMPESWSQMLL